MILEDVFLVFLGGLMGDRPPDFGGQFSGVNGDRPRTWGTVLWNERGHTPDMGYSSQESMVTDPELGGTVLWNERGQTPNSGGQFSGMNGDRPPDFGGQFSGVSGDRPRTWRDSSQKSMGTVLRNQRGQTSPSRAKAL